MYSSRVRRPKSLDTHPCLLGYGAVSKRVNAASFWLERKKEKEKEKEKKKKKEEEERKIEGFNNLFFEVHTLQIQPRYHARGNEKMLRFERTSPLFPLLGTFHVFPPTLRLKDMPSETQTHA